MELIDRPIKLPRLRSAKLLLLVLEDGCGLTLLVKDRFFFFSRLPKTWKKPGALKDVLEKEHDLPNL